jgi:hypothetical protein
MFLAKHLAVGLARARQLAAAPPELRRAYSPILLTRSIARV